MVTPITSAAEFDSSISNTDKLVVVDFFATWCGPCKMIAPMVDKFSQQYEAEATFLKVDVDQLPELAQKYEISAMPTLVFIKNGKEIAKVVGANMAAVKKNIVDNI
ncbi:Cytoplasmic thioredoxin isoenzyme 2 [Monosporozyma unispora]|nr:Cytoplasmic thioredoxin isoenzyme 2 [Kazachstania unispora]